MKLILSLTLIWLFFSTDEALMCQQCSGSCESPQNVTCPTESTRCFTSQTRRLRRLIEQRGCTTPSTCPSAGINTYALQIYTISSVIYAECCSTDLCNTWTVPVPETPMDYNFFCCGISDCTTTLQCGSEMNRCYQGAAVSSESSPVYGCANELVCSSGGSSTFFSDFEITYCCDTSRCNIGTRTRTPETTNPTPTTAPSTAPPVTPTGASTTTNTAASSCRVQLGIIHLLLGPMIFILL